MPSETGSSAPVRGLPWGQSADSSAITRGRKAEIWAQVWMWWWNGYCLWKFSWLHVFSQWNRKQDLRQSSRRVNSIGTCSRYQAQKGPWSCIPVVQIYFQLCDWRRRFLINSLPLFFLIAWLTSVVYNQRSNVPTLSWGLGLLHFLTGSLTLI